MNSHARVELRCYHYTCPECGMSDKELGHLATAEEIHCLVCHIEERRLVVLRRWHDEAAGIPMKLVYSASPAR